MMFCLRVIALLAILALMAIVGTAQAITPPPTTDFRTWFAYNGDHRLRDSRLSLVLESQLRVYEIVDRSGVVTFRTGLQYDIRNWLRVSGGYGYQITEPGSGLDGIPEHRAWEGLQLRQRMGQVQLNHRVRLEQRWLAPETAGDPYEYHNSVRYATRAIIPITKHADKKYYVTVMNEVFINFGKGTRNVFDQNRTGASFGYHLGAIGNLETGYILQAQNSAEHIMAYHNILTFALVSTFPFGKH